ncbi:hypothetical protein [Geodermatophilus sp. SYSU D00766]
MSDPSAAPGDVPPPTAQEKDIDQQVQPQGQAVGQHAPDAGDATGVETSAGAESAAAGSGSGAAAAAAAGPAAGSSTAGAGAGTGTYSTGSPPVPDADPFTRAKDELRAKRESAQKRVEGADKEKQESDIELSDADNRFSAIEAAEKDVEANVTAYKSAYAGLEAEDDAYTEYLEREEDSLTQSLGTPRVARVNELVTASKETGKKLESDAETLREELAAAERDLAKLKADSDVKKRSDVLSGWKRLTATLVSQHAELKKLRDEVTKERQAGHYGLALYLLGCAKDKREEFADTGPHLTQPANVPNELLKAINALADAENALARAEAKVTALKKKLETATKKRDQHRAKAETTLREELLKVGSGDAATTGGTDNA